MMYLRLSKLQTKQKYLINVNVFNNFFMASSDKTLFDLPVMEKPIPPYDFSNVNNLLSICLFKNDTTDKAYLTVSANLKETYRQRLGENIIRFCHNL